MTTAKNAESTKDTLHYPHDLPRMASIDCIREYVINNYKELTEAIVVAICDTYVANYSSTQRSSAVTYLVKNSEVDSIMALFIRMGGNVSKETIKDFGADSLLEFYVSGGKVSSDDMVATGRVVKVLEYMRAGGCISTNQFRQITYGVTTPEDIFEYIKLGGIVELREFLQWGELVVTLENLQEYLEIIGYSALGAQLANIELQPSHNAKKTPHTTDELLHAMVEGATLSTKEFLATNPRPHDMLSFMKLGGKLTELEFESVGYVIYPWMLIQFVHNGGIVTSLRTFCRYKATYTELKQLVAAGWEWDETQVTKWWDGDITEYEHSVGG